MKSKRFLVPLLLAFVLIISGICVLIFDQKSDNLKSKLKTISVNFLTNKYEIDDTEKVIDTYSIDDYEKFKEEYDKGKLPEIYITEFLFDGVSKYKPYDLDDFIENGNEYETEDIEIKVINIKTEGYVVLTGEVSNGMLAVNSNNLNDDLYIVLDNFKLDTDSKKVPAVYVYNKDTNYTEHKVTIEAKKDTKNYIEGGKLKKVSLLASDNLSNYSDSYNDTAKTNYENYTNYYGIYDSSELDDVLFAKIEADKEDLNDGDPLYFYKASGAISSDIDLYFEGEGYLEVISKNKEGIETKGNLVFSGGVGDYLITAQDDCLNTTLDVPNSRNDLMIDVNTLTAIVSLDGDEGDAIDSNGKLEIDGGTIIAIARPGQDAGLDSSKGTYINGGKVIATGDMYDEINSNSNQKFIVLSFGSKVVENSLITLLDSNDKNVFAYKTDRTYSILVYSDSNLSDETYTLYKDGEINGDVLDGLYSNIKDYNKGVQLGYVSKENGESRNNQGENPPEMPNGERPDGNGNPPEMPNGERPDGNGNPPEMPNGERPDGNGNPPEMLNDFETNFEAENKDFVLSGIANIFKGVVNYSEKNSN